MIDTIFQIIGCTAVIFAIIFLIGYVVIFFSQMNDTINRIENKCNYIIQNISEHEDEDNQNEG